MAIRAQEEGVLRSSEDDEARLALRGMLLFNQEAGNTIWGKTNLLPSLFEGRPAYLRVSYLILFEFGRNSSWSSPNMTLLSKLRLITVDVTGTLIAYKGQLGDYYCMAAKSAGMPCPDYERMHEGFKVAYTEMTRKHPCFGHASSMPNIDWWKMCVKDSFIRSGYDYDDDTFGRIFRRIYSAFGSSAPYSVFPDVHHFLRWLRSKGIIVGIVSNAEYRYRDVVLPALGLNQGSEWDFGVFSGIVGVEKPDQRIYEMALELAGSVAPEEALHIGDSMRKDYVPARSIGMHALLLDRFRTVDAESWRRSGAVVLPDLVSAQEWLTRDYPMEEPGTAGQNA